MDAVVDGKCTIEYKKPDGRVDRTTKLGDSQLHFDFQSGRLEINGSSGKDLFLPAHRGSLAATVSTMNKGALQVFCHKHHIILYLYGCFPPAVALFVRCINEHRQASRTEVAAVNAAAKAAREAAEAEAVDDGLNLAAGFVVATKARSSEILSTGDSNGAGGSSGGPGSATGAANGRSAEGGTVAFSEEQLSMLSDEQAAVVSAVRAGQSVFFTGSAGTGKSLVLRTLHAALPKESTSFTATTGVAAVNVQGTTLHAWAGLGAQMLSLVESTMGELAGCSASSASHGAEGMGSGSMASSSQHTAAAASIIEDDSGSVSSRVSGNTANSQSRRPGGAVPANVLSEVIASVRRKREACMRWRTTRTLVVDEVSMLDGDLFDVLDAVGRAIRGINRPWGGLQLVLTGDFFQLPPVGKAGRPKKYAFQASGWDASVPVCVELTRVFRQADGDFVDLLNEARWGSVSEESIAVLRGRWAATLPSGPGSIVPTKLHTHRADVDAENSNELAKLPGASLSYKSTDSTSNGNPAYLGLLENACPAPKELTLKLGGQVILLKTMDTSAGLVNGARGVVTGFTGTLGAADAGKAGAAGSSSSSTAPATLSGNPIVRFACGAEAIIRPESWPVKVGGAILASRRQLPLGLAWALSIHKSQGMSLDSVEMDLSKCFEAGQAYVALSRARSLEGLSLKDRFDSKCLRASPVVQTFYRTMAEKQKARMAKAAATATATAATGTGAARSATTATAGRDPDSDSLLSQGSGRTATAQANSVSMSTVAGSVTSRPTGAKQAAPGTTRTTAAASASVASRSAASTSVPSASAPSTSSVNPRLGSLPSRAAQAAAAAEAERIDREETLRASQASAVSLSGRSIAATAAVPKGRDHSLMPPPPVPPGANARARQATSSSSISSVASSASTASAGTTQSAACAAAAVQAEGQVAKPKPIAGGLAAFFRPSTAKASAAAVFPPAGAVAAFPAAAPVIAAAPGVLFAPVIPELPHAVAHASPSASGLTGAPSGSGSGSGARRRCRQEALQSAPVKAKDSPVRALANGSPVVARLPASASRSNGEQQVTGGQFTSPTRSTAAPAELGRLGNTPRPSAVSSTTRPRTSAGRPSAGRSVEGSPPTEAATDQQEMQSARAPLSQPGPMPPRNPVVVSPTKAGSQAAGSARSALRDISGRAVANMTTASAGHSGSAVKAPVGGVTEASVPMDACRSPGSAGVRSPPSKAAYRRRTTGGLSMQPLSPSKMDEA